MAPANPGPPQLCPILRLPNEVLVDIIERVAAWPDNVDYYGFRNLYADRWAMTLVCRRFHTLTMPLLYSTITLRDVIEPPFPELRSYAIPMSVPRKTVLLLHRSVKNNRGLGQLCRELVLDLRASAVDARSAVLDAAADLIDWLGSAKVLRIRDVSKDCHPGAYTSCLSAAWAMPNLEQITLSGLPTLLAVLVLKDSMSLSIKELRLTAASNRSSPDSWIFEDVSPPFPPLKVQGTCSNRTFLCPICHDRSGTGKAKVCSPSSGSATSMTGSTASACWWPGRGG